MNIISKEGKRSQRTGTMKLFLAKKLPEIREKEEKAQESLKRFFKIRANKDDDESCLY